MATGRGGFSSKLGVVLATAGSAVGLGNIWRFPYITGENGGGAFILLYLAVILFFGIPAMMAEFCIGKTAKANASKAFEIIAPGSKWYIVGLIGVIVAVIILGYYTVVTGWTLEYLFRSVLGDLQGKSVLEYSNMFDDFTADPVRPILWTAIVVFISYLIISKGVQNGIEKASKVMMPVLFIVLIILAIRSLMLPGAAAGMKFLFYPDFSKLTLQSLLDAVGQVFFSMSIGMGCMITYSSYFKKNVDLIKTSASVASIDTLVAIISAIVIFGTMFSFHMQPDEQGPGLVFKTLPNIFQQMSGGIVWALLFYILLFIASITSIISLLEVVIAYINETWHLSRIKSSRIVSAITVALGVLSALSFNLLSFVKIGGMGLFDFSDFITAKVLMPLGGIAMAIFIGWRMGREEVKNEITNMGKYPVAIYKIYMVLIRFVVPIGITAIFISSLLPH